jgi:geranylgeranyl transferase type-2 subunit beta
MDNFSTSFWGLPGKRIPTTSTVWGWRDENATVYWQAEAIPSLMNPLMQNRTMSYLGNLTLQLASGALRLEPTFRRRCADFFRKCQAPDGGFPGRQGDGDLYYTGFALRGLALLGELQEDELARRCVDFLDRRFREGTRGSIDLMSLLFGAVLLDMTTDSELLDGQRREAALAELQRLHREDAGYAKSPRTPHSSTYHTFLAFACRDLLDAAPSEEEADRVAEVIVRRQRSDGGFVELEQLRQSGTNPTAAAVGLLRLLNRRPPPCDRLAADFLASMQMDDGGLRANSRIPIADTLSTFTGLVALVDLGAIEKIDIPAVTRYIQNMEHPQGGIRGGIWDDTPDVEYTFYGLATRALLASLKP